MISNQTEFSGNKNKIVFMNLYKIQSNLHGNYLTATTFPRDKWYPRNCAIKMAATASYNAVPSMLMVAPIGSMKREICGFTLFFSSMH